MWKGACRDERVRGEDKGVEEKVRRENQQRQIVYKNVTVKPSSAN